MQRPVHSTTGIIAYHKKIEADDIQPLVFDW